MSHPVPPARPIRVGINGFGRIGRSLFRILLERAERRAEGQRANARDEIEIQIVAINDLFENDQLAYLLKYDTVMGKLANEVSSDADHLYVGLNGGRLEVAMTAERDPAQIPWAALGVDIVVESTGVFTSRAQLEKHLAAGARKVLLTVPAKDEIDATIVVGVNDHDLRPEHRLVSNASCTTNCLAPIVKILDEAFGVEEGFVTTVHAYTNDQRLADVAHKDLRRARAAAENIIPTTTGAAKAVGKVLPRLEGKLDGLAIRVPVPDGSIVDFAARLRSIPTRDEVNAAVRTAAEGALDPIVEYSEEALVSSDIIGNPHSSIFDGLSTVADSGYVKVVAWYDNEWGYSNRLVDLIAAMVAVGGMARD